MSLSIITLKNASHNNAEVVQIHFAKNNEVQNILRANAQMRWSKTMSCWYVPFSKTVAQDLFQLLKHKAFLDYTGLKENNQQATAENIIPISENNLKPNKELQTLSEESAKKIEAFKNWLRSKRYSDSTIGTYTDALKIFLRYYSAKPIAEISNTDLINFNNDYILKNKFSVSFQNQVVNAIKLFFRTVEDKKLDPALVHRPKRNKVLPNVLSKEEVKRILNAHNNVKHKVMLSLIYSCGLRCGELLRLKPEHVDSKRNLLIIKHSKGRKDRIVPLGNKIIDMLRQYFIACKPEVYLFEGQKSGEPYDISSLQKVLKLGLDKAGLNKPVTLHWLRHSYATHLLENGTDLRYIQEILGHSRSTTTEIYTHVSTKSLQKIVSPFDYL